MGALNRRYVASTLTGSITCTDGTLVVFVAPDVVPCPEEGCRRRHLWLQDKTLRECTGRAA